MPILHAVHKQHQVMLITQLAQAQQIIRLGGRHSTFALNAFHQNRDRCRRDQRPHSRKIVVRRVAKSRNARAESLLDLLLSSGRNASQGAPMKGIEGGENLEPALIVSELARQLEQPFIGLAAAITEETFARPEQAYQRLGQPALLFVIIKVRHVNELARLLDQGLGDCRVRVAQRSDGDAAAQIEITLAGHVIDVAARAVAQDQVEPPVAGDDILLKQGLNRRRIVAHDRRRRRDNIFHGLHRTGNTRGRFE